MKREEVARANQEVFAFGVFPSGAFPTVTGG